MKMEAKQRHLRVGLYAIIGMMGSTSLVSIAAPAPRSEYSIESAEHGGILDWSADSTRGIWIQSRDQRWYYASFSSVCSGLPLASSITFVAEASGELSRWSSIRVESNERCSFRNFQPSAEPPKSAVRAKATASVEHRRSATSNPPASSAVQSAAVAGLDHRSDDLASTEAAVLNPETSVVVEARTTSIIPSVLTSTPPCGLMSVIWSLAHPDEAWRLFVPLSTPDIATCLRDMGAAIPLRESYADDQTRIGSQ